MQYVEIRVEGNLDETWADWLDGFILTYTKDETILTGEIKDQAKIYGLIGKLRDMGVILLSITIGPKGEN